MSTRGVLIQHLLGTGTTLNGLVGSRIGGTLEGGGAQAAVVVFRHGGGPVSGLDADTGLFTCRCYGGAKTLLSAEAVADALVSRAHEAFSQATSAGRLIGSRVVSRFDWEDADLGVPVEVVMVEVIA